METIGSLHTDENRFERNSKEFHFILICFSGILYINSTGLNP